MKVTSLLPLLLASSASAASLLAIDYGTDAFKAALVKPGVPFDVLINSDSKRKTPSLVALRGDDRSFGGEASNLITRFPKDTFQSIKLLLSSPQSPQAALHHSLYPAHSSTKTPRGSPALASSTTSYSVEELLAMQFGYAREMAELVAGEPVREVVVTVPGWFGQSERRAMLDALDLAGLRSIGLVNDGTAAAINYAMTRTFPAEASYHLFYDFGAASLRTTIVSLRSALLPDPLSLAAKPELKNVTSLIVHGTSFDSTIGGLGFDAMLRDIMVEDFEATGGKIQGDFRAMGKLLKEAGRVKHVLSANLASVARVEGLVGETDFKTTITRDQLEARSAALIPRFTAPIHEALLRANLTLDDIESIVMIGGSSRVPMVEAAVRTLVGEDKIAKNVNADEAAVMGAALYGAGITRGFRTKDIRVQDITPYGIEVSYEADNQTADAEVRTIKTLLFPALSKLGVKKTMVFKKTSDFALLFGYDKTGVSAETALPDNLFETTLTSLTSAFVNRTADVIANSTVKVTIELNESNMLSVTKAVVVLGQSDEEEDPNLPSLNDRFKGFLGKFGKTDDPKKDDPTTVEDDAKLDELIKMSQALSKSNNGTVRLGIETVALERVPMGKEEMAEARKRLRDIKAHETRKLAREEARNVLEAYIYRARDLVDSPNFVAVSTEAERTAIKEKTEFTNEWMGDEGDTADLKELKAKKRDLERLVKGVSSRSSEALLRPALIESFRAGLIEMAEFVTAARANTTASLAIPEPPHYTLVELEAFANMTMEATEWFESTLLAQDAIKVHENPVLKVAELERRFKVIESEYSRLLKKKAPRKRVPMKAKAKAKAKLVEVEEPATVEEDGSASDSTVPESAEMKVEEVESEGGVGDEQVEAEPIVENAAGSKEEIPSSESEATVVAEDESVLAEEEREAESTTEQSEEVVLPIVEKARDEL